MEYKHGLRAGIPIALGYLSVSFTFGIIAMKYGLSAWQDSLPVSSSWAHPDFIWIC